MEKSKRFFHALQCSYIVFFFNFFKIFLPSIWRLPLIVSQISNLTKIIWWQILFSPHRNTILWPVCTILKMAYFTPFCNFSWNHIQPCLIGLNCTSLQCCNSDFLSSDHISQNDISWRGSMKHILIKPTCYIHSFMYYGTGERFKRENFHIDYPKLEFIAGGSFWNFTIHL